MFTSLSYSLREKRGRSLLNVAPCSDLCLSEACRTGKAMQHIQRACKRPSCSSILIHYLIRLGATSLSSLPMTWFLRLEREVTCCLLARCCIRAYSYPAWRQQQAESVGCPPCAIYNSVNIWTRSPRPCVSNFTWELLNGSWQRDQDFRA